MSSLMMDRLLQEERERGRNGHQSETSTIVARQPPPVSPSTPPTPTGYSSATHAAILEHYSSLLKHHHFPHVYPHPLTGQVASLPDGLASPTPPAGYPPLPTPSTIGTMNNQLGLLRMILNADFLWNSIREAAAASAILAERSMGSERQNGSNGTDSRIPPSLTGSAFFAPSSAFHRPLPVIPMSSRPTDGERP